MRIGKSLPDDMKIPFMIMSSGIAKDMWERTRMQVTILATEGVEAHAAYVDATQRRE